MYQKLSALHAALAAIPKFVKLNESGEALPHDAPSHRAVLIPAANIIVWPHSLGSGNQNHADAERLCRELCVMGHSDWRLASRDDWNHILDLTRREPAVDKSIFHGIKPRLHWTSTTLSGGPDYAWLVNASYGNVNGNPRDYDGFALAVRSAGQ